MNTPGTGHQSPDPDKADQSDPNSPASPATPNQNPGKSPAPAPYPGQTTPTKSA